MRVALMRPVGAIEELPGVKSAKNTGRAVMRRLIEK
jgi:hypothetical protein